MPLEWPTLAEGGLAESLHGSVDVENSLDMRTHHRSELGVLQVGCDADPTSMRNVPISPIAFCRISSQYSSHMKDKPGVFGNRCISLCFNAPQPVSG